MDVLDKKALEDVVSDIRFMYAISFAFAFNIITDDDLDRDRKSLRELEERVNAAYKKYGKDVVNTAVEMNMKATFDRNLNRRRPNPLTTCACADYMFGIEVIRFLKEAGYSDGPISLIMNQPMSTIISLAKEEPYAGVRTLRKRGCHRGRRDGRR